MRSHFVLLLVFSITNGGVPFAHADERAQHIVDRAIAEHGGQSVVSLGSVVQEWHTINAAIFESRETVPPWDTSQGWEGFAVDFDSGRLAQAHVDRTGGYEWVTGLQIERTRGIRIDYRSASYRTATTTFDEALIDMAFWSPVALLRWLSTRDSPMRYIGRRSIDEIETDVVDIELGDKRISLFADVTGGQVRALERSYTDYDGSRVPMLFKYTDTDRQHGLSYPDEIEVWIHGYLARQATLVRSDIDKHVDAYFQFPNAFEQVSNEPEGVRDFRFEEIARGVYFVGNGVMYQLMVEFDDYIVALDGCSGDVARRIEVTRDRIPNKEFRYVLASHHHGDHLHGLDDFARTGARIIASPAHKDVIAEYIKTQEAEVSPDFLLVDDEMQVTSGQRQLQIIDIGPVPHSENMLVVYLPLEKILFVADLFVLGGSREPVRPASRNGIALLQAIERLDLQVERIVDPHSPVIATVDDLRNAVQLYESSGVVFDLARNRLKGWQFTAK